MFKRFNDVPYHTFSFWSDMAVVCPRCSKAGTVHFNKERGIALFKCGSCYMKKETVPGSCHSFEATAQCTSTGKYFRTFLPGNKVHGQKIRIKCPYCTEHVIGDIANTKVQQYAVFENIHNAKDPYFHYHLYFQASYRGKLIWALNRTHLQYLIDYLSADIRALPAGYYETYKTMYSQSDMLPAFMKKAKNRDGIVKILIKLQAKI